MSYFIIIIIVYIAGQMKSTLLVAHTNYQKTNNIIQQKVTSEKQKRCNPKKKWLRNFKEIKVNHTQQQVNSQNINYLPNIQDSTVLFDVQCKISGVTNEMHILKKHTKLIHVIFACSIIDWTHKSGKNMRKKLNEEENRPFWLI